MLAWETTRNSAQIAGTISEMARFSLREAPLANHHQTANSTRHTKGPPIINANRVKFEIEGVTVSTSARAWSAQNNKRRPKPQALCEAGQ